jgi:integrase
VVGVTSEAYAILKRRCASGGRAFAHSDHRTHRTARNLAAKRAGWPTGITLRDLRHTHATLAAHATGDAKAVQSALGHSDLRTTERYLSSTINRTTATAAAVAEVLTRHNRVAQSGSRKRRSAKTKVQGVGVAGFEPATPCSQSRCATRLRYTPCVHS